MQGKINSVEEDLQRLVTELKRQDKISTLINEECDDKISVFEQREDALKVEMMN